MAAHIQCISAISDQRSWSVPKKKATLGISNNCLCYWTSISRHHSRAQYSLAAAVTLTHEAVYPLMDQAFYHAPSASWKYPQIPISKKDHQTILKKTHSFYTCIDHILNAIFRILVPFAIPGYTFTLNEVLKSPENKHAFSISL
ncbi:uncharacterized protein CLUP02_11950 [Colletotrichum lupini]|uniref:Uncharacterized protein n=1 Tax=Colletotrichum lupini TaxID=145971 RepID=A0A9Q8SZG4_9PEZI|nr:uncharacterized protein CLUP02_11950 [Colletotrichum lupini]UQC86449.1 hypothetical protein CLUP02_11950 [Colletotrichum lupini]